TTKEEAEKLISLGDYANFLPNYETFGDGFIKSKAIDDRFGCAVMLNLLKKSFEYDLVFVFAVQEEIGLIGSTVAAFSQNPDFALVIDATTAGDVAGVSEEDSVCKLSGGGVITIMDRHTIYDRQLVNLVMDTAKQNNINAQFKRAVAGGNDAGAVHKSRGGVRTVAISLPTRYIHSENCVAKISDIESTAKLINKAIEEIIKL
ncbi:MAG: M28 family peptidase, partial [Oscillospiraceae bacterium]